MDKKLMAAFGYAFLFIAFAAISLLVLISGRNYFFVKKKLQIGALLLSVSGTLTGCYPFIDTVTCYAPQSYEVSFMNQIIIDQVDAQSGEITISSSVMNTLTGNIRNRDGSEFSFLVTKSPGTQDDSSTANSKDSAGTILLQDNITPTDGVFDESTEEFEILIPELALPAGNYTLSFYPALKETIVYPDTQTCIACFLVNISE